MSYDYDIAYKLLQKDPVMKQIIKVTGRLIPERRQRDIYGSLLRSVTGQQLSVKAAATIHNRFLDLFPERNPEPSKVLKLSIEKLRSVGLSGQKSSYVISVAEHALRGELEFKNIVKLDDDQLIKHYLLESIENFKIGNKITPKKKQPLILPEELYQLLLHQPDLKDCFELFNLTKKREFCEYIESAKRIETKIARLQKITPMILQGIGLNDRYRNSKND